MSRALLHTQQILWETPEVTTAAKAACQPASNCLNHRFATVVTSSSSHRVRGVWRWGAVHAGSFESGAVHAGHFESVAVHAGCFESGAVHAHAANPVGDAAGHDGSEGGVSASIELPDPPLRHCRNLQFTAAPTGSGVSGGRALCMQDVLSRALFMQTQQILWETPEVTTAAKAACQPASNCLNHRFATVVTSSSSHRVRGVWRPGAVHAGRFESGAVHAGRFESGAVHAGCFESGAVHAHAANPVGDAGGHDGSEGGVSASIRTA
jgi:hypothetical protein